MVVLFQSEKVLEDGELMGVSSWGELLGVLQERTGVPREHIKLISKGKVLSEESFSTERSSPKIIMIGSSSKMELPQNTFRVKDDLNGANAPNPATESDDAWMKRLRKKRELSNPYRFHSIETLHGFEDEDHARSILQSLSNDPGVLAVMKKHRWSVGSLCEMYPEGYVGVSDVCVMGLNENKGSKIYLRLRTDDLKGFRKILSIKKVLYHELAHNEHSEHDDNFYMLMRQIEREVVELDWRQSTRGRVLGSGDATSNVIYDLTSSEHETSGGSVTSAQINNNNDNNNNGQRSHEELSDDVRNGLCGDNTMSDTTRSTPSVTPPADKNCSGEENLAETSENQTSNSALNESEAFALKRKIFQCIMNAVDESLMSYHVIGQDPPDRLLMLRDALEQLLNVLGSQNRFNEEVSHLSIHQLNEVFTLLRDIINRAKDSPDEKYRSVNKSKKLFQRVVAETGGLSVLLAAGFADSKRPGYLSLKDATDPAVLYLFVNILNKCMEVSAATVAEFSTVKHGPESCS